MQAATDKPEGSRRSKIPVFGRLRHANPTTTSQAQSSSSHLQPVVGRESTLPKPQNPLSAQSERRSPPKPNTQDLTHVHLQELSLRDGPILEALWGQAYATLKAKEPSIMSEYERCICPEMRNSRPAERMEGVVRRIYGGRETEQLVVLLAGKSFKVREAGEKVIEFIWE